MGDAIAKRVETITYSPGVQGGTDLEGATKVITATAEASGTGNADYSSALTLTTPTDARLAILRVAARLTFTIDSFDVATILYCRVYVDAQDADHRLIDTSHNAASQKIDGQDTASGTKATIFALLKDGAEHTFYCFFWVNQATSATISEVTLWEGVGHYGASAASSAMDCITLDYKGFVQMGRRSTAFRVGSGTLAQRFSLNPGAGSSDVSGHEMVDWDTTVSTLFIFNGVHAFASYSSVATDLTYFSQFLANLTR